MSLRAQETAEIIQVQEPVSDLYVKADAGPAFVQDLEVHTGTQKEFKLNAGVRFDLGAGYKFTQCLAAELECGVIWNSVDKYDDRPLSSDFYQIPIMINYIYKVPLKGPVEPFIGVGIGPVISIFDDSQVSFNATDVSFGCQAMAGLTLPFNQATGPQSRLQGPGHIGSRVDR